MTATSEPVQDQQEMREMPEPDQNSPRRGMLIRGVLRGVGGLLVLAALGLWFAPGASWDSDLILFKLILSVGFGVTGLGMLQSSMGPRTPSVEIDTNRSEIRVLRPLSPGKSVEPATYSFSELSHARLDGSRVSFWGQSDRLLAEVTMNNRRALANVVGALKDAGKLA